MMIESSPGNCVFRKRNGIASLPVTCFHPNLNSTGREYYKGYAFYVICESALARVTSFVDEYIPGNIA